MSYSKHNFSSGDTLYASQLNAMDNKISQHESYLKEDTFSDMSATSTISGYFLNHSGKRQGSQTYQIVFYTVSQGQHLYLKIAKSYKYQATYQFQSQNGVPKTSQTFDYRIGDTVTTETDAKVTVPAGATVLVVSGLQSNTTNKIMVATGESSTIDGIKGKMQEYGSNISVLNDDMSDMEAEVFTNIYTKFERTEYISAWILNTSGQRQSSGSMVINVYRVSYGQKLYLKLSKDYKYSAVYQFQSSSDVPKTSDTFDYRVGSTVATDVDGYVDVPYGANYLIVCCNTTNSTNIVGTASKSSRMSVIQAQLMSEISNERTQKQARHSMTDNTPLTLLHFSDIHADTAALRRIKEDSSKYQYDDAICTGDIVANTYGSVSSWWDEKILTCIGNHDTATYTQSTGYNWTALTMSERDATYIAPFQGNWGIVHTSGTSYYYKDYINQHVRLIVLDAMLYSATADASEGNAQTVWLESVLGSAGTNHVVIAIHAPHGGSTSVPCSFSKYGRTSSIPTQSDCNCPDAVVNAVATAISNGLHFVGYLVGHTHQDDVWDATGDKSQLMYAIACAKTNYRGSWISTDMYRDEKTDAYNLVTIDTTNSVIKLVRCGGANIDCFMRPRNAICINYASGTIISE